jgi:hypothetical protein
MARLRTIRREWKALLAGAFCLVGVAAFVHEAYRFAAHGTVLSVPGLPSLYRLYCHMTAGSGCLESPSVFISWSVHPILFLINLAVLLASMAVVSALAAVYFWGWKTEQRNLDRRDSRPPLDNAIREPRGS